MYPLSSLRTTVYHLLPAASNVSYDLSKRPHFYLRPTSCEIKYTGSQIYIHFYRVKCFYYSFNLKSLLNMSCECFKLCILSLLMQVYVTVMDFNKGNLLFYLDTMSL